MLATSKQFGMKIYKPARPHVLFNSGIGIGYIKTVWNDIQAFAVICSNITRTFVTIQSKVQGTRTVHDCHNGRLPQQHLLRRQCYLQK